MAEPKHPLALNTLVEANKPQCPCKGSAYVKISGRVKKVITNHSGHWYYLDNGMTISAQWITKVF